MRTFATVALAAITLAGCTTSPTAIEGSSPFRHVAVSQLRELPAHDPDTPVVLPSDPVDRGDPEAVTAALIVAGLAEQGLEVVDLGTATVAASAAMASVRVAATHRVDATATPHTSVYELDLIRDGQGSWHLLEFRQAQ